jgi:hypothetical protein
VKSSRIERAKIKKAAKVAIAGRILGLHKNRSSNELSLSSLWGELDRAGRWFLVNKLLRQSHHRGVHKKLAKIEIAAKQLGNLLRDVDVFRFVVPRPGGRRWWNQRCAVDARHVQDVLKIVADLAAKGREPLDFDHPVAKAFGVNRWSAFEHLVGGQLASIYEKYSRKKVKFKRAMISGRSQSLKGDFLSFAVVALRELKITQSNRKPYSAEHIGRAYRRVKSGKPRQDRRRKPKI